MKTYYKATRPDGLDFYSGTVDYAAAVGGRVTCRTGETRKKYDCCTPDVLHAADVPTETLVGGSWPCRLFEVTGRPVAKSGHKYGFRSLRVIREVDGWQALGPQGREVAALVERARRLTPREAEQLAAAWVAAASAAWVAAADATRDAAGDAAWVAAGDAAWVAAADAAWDAAAGAARAAAWALVVRDLLDTHHYNTLTLPWATTIGPVHPDDEQAIT